MIDRANILCISSATALLMLLNFELGVEVTVMGCWQLRVCWGCDAEVINDIGRALQNDEWLLLTVICLWKFRSRFCAFARSLSSPPLYLLLLSLVDYIVGRIGAWGLFDYPLILLTKFSLDFAR